MKAVSIVRDRGQLTIPDSIRRIVNWIGPMSAVTISISKPDEIIIRPHSQIIDKEIIWGKINKSRMIKGKGKLSTAEFLTADRQSH